MSQASSFHLTGGAVQKALLPLTGQRVNQGSGATAVQSTVAGFELQASSGLAPSCSNRVTWGCVNFPDERSADLKYVGATSDQPQLASIGQNVLTSNSGFAYFSVTTQGRWRTPASSQEFDIYIDSTGDGVADSVVFNTRLTATDVMVSELYDLKAQKVVDVELINDRFGDTDTALLDSDTMVIPVWVPALPGISAATSRLKYAVFSYSPYQAAPVDQVGDVGQHGNLVNPLSLDVLHPGIAVYGSYDGDTSPLLFRDSPGSVLAVRRDVKAYAADRGKGVLMIHFHNALGHKAQVVSLNKNPAKATLSLKPNPVVHNRTVTATVHVSGISGITPTGTVVLRRLDGPNPANVARGTLVKGRVVLHYTPRSAGRYHYRAQYGGNSTYGAANSVTVTLKVTR
jgi:hypothetical protein